MVNPRPSQSAADYRDEAAGEGRRAVQRRLADLLGTDCIVHNPSALYRADGMGRAGPTGIPDAVVLPRDAAQVEQAFAWCYEHNVPIVPRGGGTGLAGGAAPISGGVVIGLERLNQVTASDPLQWRMSIGAGARTADVQRRARENGLHFAPDPGAAEQSQIGGNVATNAGGPHAFKYGVTGDWVTGLEVVVAPGRLVHVGGTTRKNAAGYDMTSVIVGSEGTLAVVTSVDLKLLPAPETAYVVAAFYEDAVAGCAAVAAVMGSGLLPAAIEFLDEGALLAAAGSYPGEAPNGARFAVLAEADGSRSEARALLAELEQALAFDALRVDAALEPSRLWAWRDGVSHAVAAQQGGKFSEDVVVPVEQLSTAVAATQAIGARHGLLACSWGHAGDGNLHASFLLRSDDRGERARAELAASELCNEVVALGGSVSGEHGIGAAKRGDFLRLTDEGNLTLQRALKKSFDPKGLLNPGKVL